MLSICDLSDLGLIHFSGDDAQSFLQSQLTCDVADLAAHRSVYSSYCTPKGRMLAAFLLWRAGPDFFMQLPASLREAIQKQLSKYILRAKVKASDTSAAYACFGISGDGARDLLNEVFGDAPAAVHEVRRAPDATLLKLPVERYEVVVAATRADEVREGLQRHAAPASAQDWNWLDIRAGIPVITPATQGEFVPQMVNLDLIGGLSFTKGCFPGQEIVARMHYRGQLKQRMYLAHIPSEISPQPGDKLYAADFGEQSCGMIVNAAPAPEGGYDALAVIQMSSAEAGEVHWKGLDGPALRFLPLPYWP